MGWSAAGCDPVAAHLRRHTDPRRTCYRYRLYTGCCGTGAVCRPGFMGVDDVARDALTVVVVQHQVPEAPWQEGEYMHQSVVGQVKDL